jgi:hypothetical protein
MGDRTHRDRPTPHQRACKLAPIIRDGGPITLLDASILLGIGIPQFNIAYRDYFLAGKVKNIVYDGEYLRYQPPVAASEDEIIEAGKALIELSRGGGSGNGKKRTAKAEATEA